MKKVFLQYEQTISSANNLSAAVCNVYFNSVLSNPNFNYTSKKYSDLTEQDITRISIDTRARMYYYKSIYANIYHQLYVKGGNLAEQLSSGNTTLPTYEPYNYIKGVINSSPNPTAINNKKEIYDNIVNLYNMQKTFNTAYQHFTTATNNVTFKKVTSSISNNDINYGKIITGFAYGMAYDSHEILKNLITLLYTT